MANVQMFYLMVLFSRFLAVYNQAIGIDISPEKYDKVTTNSVHISCVPGGDLNVIKDILLIELYKDDKPMVILHSDSKVLFSIKPDIRLQAVGHIDKHVSQSYLNLTLFTPCNEDSGKYTCQMYYLNNVDFPAEERDSKNLTEKEESADLGLLLISVKYLKEKVWTLENTVKKLSYQNAFSVMTGSQLMVRGDKPIALPDVMLLIGDSYNVTSGIFTAPLGGIYVFYMIVAQHQDLDVDMKIIVNDNFVAKLYVAPLKKGDAHQTSISSVVNLTVGDEVYIRVDGSKSKFYILEYTMFSGYLIQAS